MRRINVFWGLCLFFIFSAAADAALQDTTTADITAANGETIAASNFIVDNLLQTPEIALSVYSYSLKVLVPLSIISRINRIHKEGEYKGDEEYEVVLGDGAVLRGHCRASFTFDRDLGHAGYSIVDIETLVFKHEAATQYTAAPPGKHEAVVYLKSENQLVLAGASFMASTFRNDPQYRDPVETGYDYPEQIKLFGDTRSTFVELSWEQIQSIEPFENNVSGSWADCMVTTKTGRELTGRANYWWTADRIQGIASFGAYQLPVIVTYSDPAIQIKDYIKIELR